MLEKKDRLISGNKKALSGLAPGSQRLPSLPLSRYARPDYILAAFILAIFG